VSTGLQALAAWPRC